MGLIIGMELTVPGAGVVTDCLARGLIINCAAEKTLRFLPPLVITEADVDEMLSVLVPVLDGLDA